MNFKVLLLLFLFPLLISYPQVLIKNSSFESVKNGAIENWLIKSGAEVNIEKNSNNGSNCAAVTHKDFSSTTLISEKIKLQTGRLYKLSGFIKTENAFTNPYEQYPTPVAACLSMKSFPFTNHSFAVGATNDWQKVEVVFIATTSEDNISLNFGLNGTVKGKVWFDDITIEEVDDITKYIAAETIKWYDKGFRFDNDGWIFIHIEGEPYQRGFQYGYLAAEEIKEFITKFGTKKNLSSPVTGWNDVRFMCDALFLRKYDEEFLIEMKGIAEGVNKAGTTVFNRPVDLIDIVAMNSSIDLDYSSDALHYTANKITGKTFTTPEDEISLQDKLHKCSGLLATKSATLDHRIVFGQLFMWNGYMGPHWNVIVDMIPSKGNRLVYQTFPGGIHSGADFYVNSSGIMIGETTVNQTPFNSDGTPQSNRIRRAAQYANSIDDVVKILTENNNGLYTNDWLIGDTKTDEIAILVLGTEKYKLWRSSENDFYNGQKDWYWSDNNNKSLDVRKEYIVNEGNAPNDLIFKPVNRDLSFWQFYEENKGKIDANSAIDLFNTSPVNRPHACDGKVITSEMAENLMFFINYGKTTMREMFINENGRIPDQPGAIPRLSLGYSVISPLLFTEKIKELKEKYDAEIKEKKLTEKIDDVKENFSVNKDKLWQNTVYPSNDDVNWFISGTASYRNFLSSIPDGVKGVNFQKDEFAGLNCRYLYFENKEGTLKPVETKTVYNQYKYYQLPAIKGTILLHQLRLLIGNDLFLASMNEIHNTYKEKDISLENIITIFNKISGKELNGFIEQWITRDDIPELEISSTVEPKGDLWLVKLSVKQLNKPYHLLGMISIETEKENTWIKIEVDKAVNTFEFIFKDKPAKLVFNSGNDFLTSHKNFYTFSNFTDEFANIKIVYGTVNQSEAGHTLALRFQKTAADRFTEILLPVVKDNEITENELKNNDLVIIGGPETNTLMKKVIEKAGIKAGKNYFYWNGKCYGNSDEGIFIAIPNPYNESKTVYMFISNSSLQLYNMLKNFNRMPQWAIFKKDQISEKGYFIPQTMEKNFNK